MDGIAFIAGEIANLEVSLIKEDSTEEDLTTLSAFLLTVKESMTSVTAAFTASTTGFSGNVVTLSGITIPNSPGSYIGQYKATFSGGNISKSEPFIVRIESKLD